MKILSLFLLFSLTTYANSDISKFKGQTYKKSNYDLCLRDYDGIQKNVDMVKEYTVLGGGCVAYGNDNFKLEFDYMHPLAGQIEEHSFVLADELSCKNALMKTESEIIASGNHFVTSYCLGKEITSYMIDTTYSMVRSLKNLGKFTTQPECSNFLTDLTAKANTHKITSFISYCQETKYDLSGEIYFSPVFTYISFHDIELGLINGKIFPTQSACSDNSVNIEQNFSKNNIKDVTIYCPGVMGAGSHFQETVLYLIPKDGRYIVDYEGVLANSSEACNVQLDSIVSSLERAGQNVLYAYCKKISDKYFKPTISYLKTIEL